MTLPPYLYIIKLDTISRVGASPPFVFMDWLPVLIMVMAAYRLVLMFHVAADGTRESGPWDILDRLRYFLGVGLDGTGLPYDRNELGALFLCPRCLSFWVGLLLVLAYALWPPVLWGYLVLAVSGGAIWLGRK